MSAHGLREPFAPALLILDADVLEFLVYLATSETATLPTPRGVETKRRAEILVTMHDLAVLEAAARAKRGVS